MSSCRTAAARSSMAREPEWWSGTIYKQHLEDTMVKKRVKHHSKASRNASSSSQNSGGGGGSSGSQSTSTFTASRQTGLNRLGGQYQSGKPLPLEIRKQIIAMADTGAKPTEISKQLKVSHGGVSKIIARFRSEGTIMPNKIGGSKPKKSRPEILAAIQRYRQLNPTIRASTIQQQLLNDDVVEQKQLPSISLINRIIRYHLPEQAPGSVDSGLGSPIRPESQSSSSACSTTGSDAGYASAVSDQLMPMSPTVWPTQLNEFLMPNSNDPAPLPCFASPTRAPIYEVEHVSSPTEIDALFNRIQTNLEGNNNDASERCDLFLDQEASYSSNILDNASYHQYETDQEYKSESSESSGYVKAEQNDCSANLNTMILVNDIVSSYNSAGLPVLDIDDCIYGLE